MNTTEKVSALSFSLTGPTVSRFGSPSTSFSLIIANMMKSMLQQLDSSLASKENLIHEQNCRLAEKEKVIQSNKTEIDRLEKKNKTQEHKVLL